MHGVMVLGGITSSTANLTSWGLRRQQSPCVEMLNLTEVGIPMNEPRHQQDQTQR